MLKHSSLFFRKPRHTFANEDASLEHALLPENCKHALALAGSGTRLVPLLSRSPQHLTLVDLSSEQLFITELRLEAIRRLNHRDFLEFFGYCTPSCKRITPEQRKKLFEMLHLSKEAHDYISTFFNKINWHAPLYAGSWEKNFRRCARLNRFITGKSALKLFEFRKLEDQIHYYKNHFPQRRWSWVIGTITCVSLLQSTFFARKIPRKNVQRSFYSFYKNAFDHLFTTQLARANYLLEMSFFGRIVHAEASLPEADPSLYKKAQMALKQNSSQVTLLKGDLFKMAPIAVQQFGPIQFLALSDVASYFHGKTEQNFLRILHPLLECNARVVIRNYMRTPRPLLDKEIHKLKNQGYLRETGRFSEVILSEKTGVYETEILRTL